MEEVEGGNEYGREVSAKEELTTGSRVVGGTVRT